MHERYEKFTSLILNINRYILKIKNSQMHEFGLKGNQVQCLYFLFNEEKGLNAKQLSEICEEDKAAISRTLKELESKGLVVLNEENKKYRNPYTLTQKGKELGKIIALKIDGIMDIASVGIREDERKILYSLLNKINDNLKNICESKGEKI